MENKTIIEQTITQDVVISPKLVSHFERCAFGSKLPFVDVCKPIKTCTFNSQLDSKTNRVVKRAKIVEVNRYEDMKKYKVSDFSLENLQAIGAQLNPIHSNKSRFSTLESIENNMLNTNNQ